jgi:hypothetical protein
VVAAIETSRAPRIKLIIAVKRSFVFNVYLRDIYAKGCGLFLF